MNSGIPNGSSVVQPAAADFEGSETQTWGSSSAVRTERLTRNFDGFCAVDRVNLRVERGTFYGFLGPNGARKSTTIKMLTGLMAPSSGYARVLGGNVFDPDEALEV